MSDETLCFATVLCVLVFNGWCLWFLWKAGLLQSKIVEKGILAWAMYMQARTWDQKIASACIGLIILTFSVLASVWTLLGGLSALVVGAMCKYSDLMYLFELLVRFAELMTGAGKPTP